MNQAIAYLKDRRAFLLTRLEMHKQNLEQTEKSFLSIRDRIDSECKYLEADLDKVNGALDELEAPEVRCAPSGTVEQRLDELLDVINAQPIAPAEPDMACTDKPCGCGQEQKRREHLDALEDRMLKMAPASPEADAFADPVHGVGQLACADPDCPCGLLKV